MDNIGEKLKDFFKEKNITQVQIADMTGVNQSYIAALLNNTKQFGKKTAQKWGGYVWDITKLVIDRGRRNDEAIYFPKQPKWR